MYLKRLEIQGFKSFANKTILDFLPPQNGSFSITGVVGPNGSGKSNITDAIRWVMGEQSMRNIRAKKSEDIIFSGSESKGSLGAAEVAMTLDNAGGETGLEFPEIIITRRLYRSGESEYLVNGNPARLIDIHILLAKAKFAEGAYSIVSQGMIDRLLTVTPAERKDFFDEASGIKEHQIKQHQAQLKLGRSEENIKQAETLLAEVEPRLKLLARQVKKLEQRQEVEARLRDTQEMYYFTLYSHNKKEVDEVQGLLAAVETKYRNAFAELEKIQVELAELAKGATRQEVFESLQERHQETMRAKNELERQLVIIEGQMQTEYSQSGRQNVGWLEGKVAELNETAKLVVERSTAGREESEEKAKAVTEKKHHIDRLAADQSELRLKISRLQSELFKDQSERSFRELSGLTAVKAVMEAKNNFGKIFGLVAELGEVEEKYQVALEVAVGAQLSSIVVQDETVARRAIEYLRQNRFGVATFLPLSRIQPRQPFSATEQLLQEKGVHGRAIDLIRFDEKMFPIFSMILGDTLVIDDLHVAERIGVGRGRFVTLEGDLVEPRGIMRGGFRQRRNNLSFSSKLSLTTEDHAAEIQEMVRLESHNLNQLESQIEKEKNDLVDITVAAESAKNQAALAEAEYNKIAQELARFKNELALLKSSPEEYGAELQKLAGSKKNLQEQIDGIAATIEKIETEIKEFNAREEEKKQRVFALQEQMQKQQEMVNGFLGERSEFNIRYAKLETKQEDLANEVVSEMKLSLPSIIERLSEAALLEEVPGLADRIEKLKYQLSLIGGIDEEVVKEYSTTKERYDFLVAQIDDLQKAIKDLTVMIEELDELMKKRRSAAFKKIRKDFDRYFKLLFGGGNAALEEIYGEPPREEGELNPDGTPVVSGEVETEEVKPKKKSEKILTGVEVIANPPGKKVKYLNMLSGGERTLTSIALISAILYNNPSPFVVLDEVEAALDEANTLKFAKIMAELATHSQFIIVTHNRVTMHAANALYGVVMQGDGVSKLLSVKIEDVPEYSGN